MLLESMRLSQKVEYKMVKPLPETIGDTVKVGVWRTYWRHTRQMVDTTQGSTFKAAFQEVLRLQQIDLI